MMSRRWALPAFAAALFVSAAALSGTALAEASFLAEIEDLPLAPGLVEQPGGTLFDTPEGRIVEATAMGERKASEVSSFYADDLPPLGWTRIDAATYKRDKEVLHIQIDSNQGAGGTVSVRFSLAPARPAP